MKLHRTVALVALTVVSLVFLGSAAQASNPSGYKLVESFQYTSPPFSQTHGVATCPGAKVPAGGGVFNESGGFPSAINSSYPSGKTWQVDVNNPTSTAGGFIVFVVCLHSPTKYAVVTSTATATNGVQSSHTVTCPAHSKVTGGGALSSSSSTAVNFNSSIPASNGWRVDINNTSGSDSNFTVYAVCRAKPLGYTILNSGPITNPAGAQTIASRLCPLGGGSVAIGGGALSSSSSTSVQMNSSFADGNGGWTVFEQNLTASSATVTTYAICAGT